MRGSADIERAESRERFGRGYLDGVHDVSLGRVRQLTVTDGGWQPAVSKDEDAEYYHGYKAAAEGKALDEDSAWAGYVAKHSMQHNAARRVRSSHYRSSGSMSREEKKRAFYEAVTAGGHTLPPDWEQQWDREYDEEHAMQANARTINVGDTVRLTGKFLRSTGQYAGGEGQSRWKVLEVEPSRHGSSVFVVVDEPKSDEDMASYTEEEIRRDPSLKWRRINAANLEVVKRAMQSNARHTGEPIAKRWMRDALRSDTGELIDRRTGEVNLTRLAEECAHSLGHSDWLDDETHPVWDWAIEVSEEGGYASNAGPMGQRAIAQSRMVGPSEADGSPIGTLLWADDRAWVVVPGGIAPVAILSERAGGYVPDGQPAGTIASEFALMREGNGRVPTHGTAQRHAIAWVQAARTTPNPLHLKLDGNFSFGIGTEDDKAMTANARKNVSSVINAFLAGRRHSEKTCSTDGWRLYSYSLLIAARVDENGEPIDVGAPGARIVVLDTLASPSRTTSSQINAVLEAVPGAEVVSDMPYAARYLANAEHEPNIGMYKGTGAETDDYVVFPTRSGGFGVDWVMRGGTHMTIGPTKGYPSLEAAMQGARDDGFKRGRTSGIIYQQREDGLHQVGHVKKSHENYADNPRKGQFKTPADLTPAEAFFFEMSGYVGREGHSATEVKRERIAQAKAMAAAEAEAERRGWTFKWEYDETPDISWMDEEARDDLERGATEMLQVLLLDENGEVLESMGGVHVNARGGRDPYIRVVEAEMISEALHAEESAGRAMALNSAARPNPWYRSMNLAQVVDILGAEEVARVLAVEHPAAHATVRARGWWDANDGDRHDAYTSLARLVNHGELTDLIAETRATR